MKKSFAFISLFLCMTASMLFAEITAKKLDDGSVEATFFYANPRASEVLLAGDFTNWQGGALPMTKGEKGFTLVKVFPKGTTLRYKFVSDGNWTTDLKAPDFVDDGFGGKNGLAVLDSLVGGGTTAKSGLKFLTWSMIGYHMKFNASKSAKDLESAGINLKSYFKITGDALPNVPVYFEIATAEKDSFENLYKKGSLGWDKGLLNFVTDLAFDPLYYFNGPDKDKTYLGHFKAGISSDYVNWTTGYKYAKLPPHSINGWTTVDQEWEAGYNAVGGFNYFELGQKLQTLPFGTLKAAIAPNRSADRAGSQYGMFAWANLNLGSYAVIDLQYNGAYGKEFDKIFKDIMETDIIAGYKGTFGPVTVKANYLFNMYGSYVVASGVKSPYTPASSDVGSVSDKPKKWTDNMASKITVGFTNDIIEASIGYRFRGAQANLMFVEEGADDHYNVSGSLGSLNHQRVFGSVTVKAIDGLSIGLKGNAQFTFDKDSSKKLYKNDKNVGISIEPSLSMDFNELFWIPGKLKAYAVMSLATEKSCGWYRGADSSNLSNFLFKKAGLKYETKIENDIINGVEVMYGFDNTNKEYLFNTLIGTLKFAKDYNVQVGAGLRTANKGVANPYNPVGFFVGGYKKLPVLAKPTAYCQVLYAMDPYKKFGDGPSVLNMDDCVIAERNHDKHDAVTDFSENVGFRIGLAWDL